MKIVFYVYLLLLLTAIMACKTEDVFLGEDYELALNETVDFAAGGFTILFDEVTEDSRCPTGVECFWEGRAIVQLIVAEGTDSTDIQLATYNSVNLDSMLIAEYQNYSIELKEVNPYPHIDSLMNGNEPDYSILIHVDEL